MLIVDAALASFVFDNNSSVQLCTRVVYPNTTTVDCADFTTTEVPPQPVNDVVYQVADMAIAAVDGLQKSFVDPQLCPRLVSLAPGIPGVVDIGSDGDTRVVGFLVYECPPYSSSVWTSFDWSGYTVIVIVQA